MQNTKQTENNQKQTVSTTQNLLVRGGWILPPALLRVFEVRADGGGGKGGGGSHKTKSGTVKKNKTE